MNDKERNDLAVDIARRVRLMSWQPMPETLNAVLPEFGFSYQFAMPYSGPQGQAVMQFYYTPRPRRLELEWRINGEAPVGRMLWTPEQVV